MEITPNNCIFVPLKEKTSVQLKDKYFEEYINSKDVQQLVASVASRINEDYKGKHVVFLGVLNGAFMFAADLLKSIDLSCEISFVKMSSYKGTSSTGEVHELIGLVTDLTNKHVVIVEDIVDTGLTLNKLFAMVRHDKPASVEIATLLFKPSAFKGTEIPKYIGREIPNKFVVGYGLDYDGLGRNSDAILKLKEK